MPTYAISVPEPLEQKLKALEKNYPTRNALIISLLNRAVKEEGVKSQ